MCGKQSQEGQWNVLSTVTMVLPHIYFLHVTDNTLGHQNWKNSDFAFSAYSPDFLIHI